MAKAKKPVKAKKVAKPAKAKQPVKATKVNKPAKAKAPAKPSGSAWDKLSHAYGKATDLPDKLAALTSSSAKARAEAIYMIGASICHQGTFYSATPVTIPRLLEIVATSATKDKHAILRLLADILTIDDHEPFLLGGMPPGLPPSLPAVYAKSITAARAGFDIYVALLRDPAALTRAYAAFALTWIADRAADALGPVRAALDTEKDAVARASLALTLAYLAQSAGNPAAADPLRALVSDREAIVKTAAALGRSHLLRGAVDATESGVIAEAARDPKLLKTDLPWLGGNVAHLALRVLSALPASEESNQALLAVIEGKGDKDLGANAAFAANVLARRLLPDEPPKAPAPKPKREPARGRTKEPIRHDRENDRALEGISISLADLPASTRTLLEKVARTPGAFDGDLAQFFASRGYPASIELLRRFLSEEGPQTSPLDAPVKTIAGASTVADAIVAIARAQAAQRPALAQALVAELGGSEAFGVLFAAMTDLDVENDYLALAELAWAAGPTAEKAIAASRAVLERDGEPTRTRGENKVSFPNAFVYTAIAECSRALARGAQAPTWVDAWLQKTYGFIERTRDALAALPPARRDAWLLDKDRDNELQPAEYFKGAWPYWVAGPSPKVVARALERVAEWKPKDRWGGKRDTFATPHLVALRDAVKATGGDTKALDAALARFGR